MTNPRFPQDEGFLEQLTTEVVLSTSVLLIDAPV